MKYVFIVIKIVGILDKNMFMMLSMNKKIYCKEFVANMFQFFFRS